MSNFLKNLAKRSAGLPLVAECGPRPSPAFESSFEASEGLNEITLNEITLNETPGGHVEAPTAGQSQTLNGSTTPQVQRSSPEQIGTTAIETMAVKPRPPSAQDATTTILKPASSVEEVVSSNEIVPSFRGESKASARLADDTVAAPFESVPTDSEFTPRAKATRAQTALSVRRSAPAATNPPATTLRRREEHESLSPEVTVKAADETVPDKLALVATDHLIRPAATEPTISFQFPRIATASPQPSSTTPIQVRIGRVEVRGAPPVQQPTPTTPRESPPLGFASYQRLRRYRY